MWKKHQIVLLPAKETGIVMLKKSTNKLVTDFHSTRNTSDHIAHELFILSNEAIKEDDWFYDGDGELCHYTKKYSINPNNWKDNKKIICTTDTSLKIGKLQQTEFCKFEDEKEFIQSNLPQPSQKFIEEYITSYNNGRAITEIEVEYENKQKTINYHKDIWVNDWIVKVNSDNTINIKLVKDSYSREEVIELIQKCNKDRGENLHELFYIRRWIQDNL